MMIPTCSLKRILAEYPDDYRPEAVAPLEHTGLSGAAYWKIATRSGLFCLRCWPRDTPLLDRLQYAQAVLWHAVCEGVDFVPLPIETLDHKGHVSKMNRCWELLPWLGGKTDKPQSLFVPGLPGAETETEYTAQTPTDGTPRCVRNDYRKMQVERVAAAMIALAQFHEATSTFPLPNEPVGCSEYACRRLDFWRRLPQSAFSEDDFRLENGPQKKKPAAAVELRRRVQAMRDQELRLFLKSFYPSLISQLEWASKAGVSIQPNIGNAHRRHLLFDCYGFSGIVDFKAMGADSVARDIASLLGSLAGNDTALWHYGLISYGGIRPLSTTERRMIAVLDLEQSLSTSWHYLDRLRTAGGDVSPSQTEVMLDEIAWQHHRLATWNLEQGAA